MNKHRSGPPLFQEVLSLVSCQARPASAVDPAAIPLEEYEEIATPGVLRHGLSVRAAPGTQRLALVPQGGRTLLWTAGIADGNHPIIFPPDAAPKHLAVVGPESGLRIELQVRDLELTVTAWPVDPTPSLTLPAPPSAIEFPAPIAVARRAAACGGISDLASAGLVLRFATPRLADLLDGSDPLATWKGDIVSAMDDEQAASAAALVATMAVDWAESWRRLADTLDPDEPAWTADLWETLRLRDDLASAVRILRLRDVAGEVDGILAQADGAAAEWIAALPIHLVIEDEHLAEVARHEDPLWAQRAWLPRS